MGDKSGRSKLVRRNRIRESELYSSLSLILFLILFLLTSLLLLITLILFLLTRLAIVAGL